MAYVWMKVTKDKYELPVAVAETHSELARICGTTPGNVLSSASRYRHGQRRGGYIRVEVEEEEEE